MAGPLGVPAKCACGAVFSVEHALSMPQRGVSIHQTQQNTNLTATLLTEVCKDVCIEPDLQPVFEELNGATANSQPGAKT